ncbi:hypothetical protein [Streptomyces sp. NPDC001292]|uniref:hypothetical protein n=1 Tax=Streptomyces sp. NPDC001292 TaxID=3364558 RepID=UPI00367908E1
MLPGPAAAAETQVLPGVANAAAPGAPAGAGTDPFGPAYSGPAGTGQAGTGPLRVQVEDPWETHDPHEVTVQLDAVSLRPGGTLGSAGPAGKEADRPVFVDESGRRSRRFRRLGMVIGLACAVYAVVIVVTLMSGNAAAPWVPVRDPASDEQPAGKVRESPRQSGTSPSADTSGLPEATTDPSAPTVPSAGVTPPAGSTAIPGAPAAPGGTPAASSHPAPSVTSTKKATPDRSVPPATGGNGSSPGTNPSPDPAVSEPGQGPDPSPPGNSGGSGVTTNAGGAATANPVATTGPAADRPGVTPDHSPENVL